MSTPEEVWTTRLHAAVDDHPSALTFDVRSYVTAGHRRARRNRGAAVAATIALIAAGAVVSAVTASRGGEPQPAPPVAPHVPASAKTPNGWVAVDLRRDNGQGAAGAFHTNIYLVRPGDEPLPLDVAGSDAASDAC